MFAFSLTLLVVELVVPTSTAKSPLSGQLLAQWPALQSYLLSFVVVALNWYGHHEVFRFIRRTDGRLIVLNFAVLLLIAFLPFPTAVLGRNGGQPIAAVIYASTLTLMNVASGALWWYATRGHRLVDPDLDQRLIKRRYRRLVISSIVFLVSIPVAVWRPFVAEALWVPLFAVFFLVGIEPGRTRRS